MSPLTKGIRIACVLVALAFTAYVVALATIYLPPEGGLDGPCEMHSGSWSSTRSDWPPGYRCIYRNREGEVVRIEGRSATWADEVVIALLAAAAVSLAAGIAGGARDQRRRATRSSQPSE